MSEMLETDYYGKSHAENREREIVCDIRMAWDRHERVDVECSFTIGDLFNSFTGGASNRRSLIEHQFGEVLYKRFRHFGWVAARWPGSERGAKHCWSYYRDNDPGGDPVTSRKYSVQFCAVVKKENRNGDVYLTCLGSHEREFETRITWPEYVAIGQVFSDGVFAEDGSEPTI